MIDQISKWINGLDKMEIFFIIYFGVLFLIWIFKSDEELEREISFSFFKKRIKYELAVNKKEFVNEVVRWALSNINYEGANQLRKRVDVEVSYYPHKKHHGVFYSSQRKIKVYVNNHFKVDDLIDTSLHEAIHLLQYYSDKQNFEKRYTKLLQEKTYAKHPMEIEARKIAADNTKACKNYLISKGKIRPVTI